MAELQRVVDQLVAREAIREVLADYARALDGKDRERLARAFTADGVLVSADGTERTVEEFAGYVEGVLERFVSTMHFVGSQSVEVDLDRGRAEASTYAVAYHLQPDGSDLADLVMGLDYLSELRHEDGGWRIARHHIRPRWVRGPMPARPGA
jgi:uncharacterized protein (TIGR02246 family)